MKGYSTDYEYILMNSKHKSLGTVRGTFDPTNKSMTLDPSTSDEILAKLPQASILRVDNSWPIAVTSYHRHQAPKGSHFDAWNQFKNTEGTFKYPQRLVNAGELIARGASEKGSFTGKFNGKMIVISNLYDVDAYPWHGD